MAGCFLRRRAERKKGESKFKAVTEGSYGEGHQRKSRVPTPLPGRSPPEEKNVDVDVTCNAARKEENIGLVVTQLCNQKT